MRQQDFKGDRIVVLHHVMDEPLARLVQHVERRACLRPLPEQRRRPSPDESHQGGPPVFVRRLQQCRPFSSEQGRTVEIGFVQSVEKRARARGEPARPSRGVPAFANDVQRRLNLGRHVLIGKQVKHVQGLYRKQGSDVIPMNPDRP